MIDQDILEGFVAETYDMLDEVEPILIELTKSGDASGVGIDTINLVFRLFHSMKGSAGFLGLDTVSRITHEAETLLDLFRKEKATLQTDHTNALCRTIDFIRLLLDSIEGTGSDAGHEAEATDILSTLHGMVASLQAPAAAPPPAPTPVPEASIPAAASATVTPPKDVPSEAPHPSHSPSAQEPAFLITDALRVSFRQEVEENVDMAEQSMLALENASGDVLHKNLTAAFRALHTIKGNSGFMGFADLERLAHHMENTLDGMRHGTIPPDPGNVSVLLNLLDVLRECIHGIADGKDGSIPSLDVYFELLQGEVSAPAPESVASPQTPGATSAPAPVAVREETEAPAPAPQASRPALATPRPEKAPPPKTPSQGAQASGGAASRARQDIRVDVGKLDSLINLVGELVIAESMVTRHPHVEGTENESLERAVHLLRRVSRDLQDVAMSARMVPLAATFRKMIRLVHDLSHKAGKDIHLKLLGEDTEVDKTVIEQIADPLVHIVRNACDHGIETPDERKAAGKPPQANVTIEGRHEGGEVWILISDDGRGLNRAKILRKAQENGLVGAEAEEWPDERIFKLVFEPGFSTADAITDISGRGVGMDVVKKNIESMKGKIDIRSRLGKGSTFILRIPLTLAIIEGMLIRVGGSRYTIPMLAIRESLRPQRSWITKTPDGEESVRIRDDFYPVLRLHERFRKTPDTTDLTEGILVLVESDGRTIAIFADELLGQQETVIKGMSGLLEQSEGVSGCTILGDGEVSLILDIAGLVIEREGVGFA